MWIIFMRLKNAFRKYDNNKGIGVVEIILILVILIALVLIFKNKITEIVNDAFSSIQSDSSSIIEKAGK